MLEIWNLVRKYTHIWNFRRYKFHYQEPLNFADVSIFLLKSAFFSNYKWRHNLSRLRHRQILLKLSCFSCQVKLLVQVNTITGSGVMTIFVNKGLTSNLEIRNTLVWVLPNNWRLGRVEDTKFSTNVSNEMLLNATKCQGCSIYRFWFVEGKPTGGRG